MKVYALTYVEEEYMFFILLHCAYYSYIGKILLLQGGVKWVGTILSTLAHYMHTIVREFKVVCYEKVLTTIFILWSL